MNNSLEIWRPVVFKDKAYPGYEVSNQGRVRKVETGAVIGSTSQRYPSVTMHRDRKSYTVYIHLLVAAAFIGPRPVGTHVCWHDGNRRNIAADNLYYGTGKAIGARSVQRDLGQNAAESGRYYTGGSSAYQPWVAGVVTPPSPLSAPRLRLVTFREEDPLVTGPHLRHGTDGNAALGNAKSEDRIQCHLQNAGGGKCLIMTQDMLEHLGIMDTVDISFQKECILVTAPASAATIPPGGRLRFAHARS